ncbi:tyrosine-type recombinase/integrase [Candidatus Dojkabacteria bacterium]|nr:tyrosine-type recombinase/integrase [Candidatus Dojkabacteria bacterium]
MLDKLPNKKDFLLNLINNNYSQRTIENYARDLLIFELFLNRYSIDFDEIDKLKINEYKGYLKYGKHLEDLEILKKDLRKERIQGKDENYINIEDKIDEKVSDSSLILSKALSLDVLEKSRLNAFKSDSQVGTSGISSKSINRMLSTIRSYINFLVDIDKKIPIPAGAIKLVKSIKKETQIAEFDELIKLVEAPDTFEIKLKVKYRNRAILELLFSTGMRISELVNLNLSDFNYNKEENKILDNKIYILGKGKKQRYVYLTDRSIFYLERYLKVRTEANFTSVFLPYRGKRFSEDNIDNIRISQRYVQNIIKIYQKRLGILIPTTPHSLRHGFATYMAEKGANPVAIQRLLGHESLQTTTRYVHSSDKFAQESHQKFHPLS